MDVLIVRNLYILEYTTTENVVVMLLTKHIRMQGGARVYRAVAVHRTLVPS